MHATVILEIHVRVYFVAFKKCNLIIIIIIMGRMGICFVEILVFIPLWCVWLHPQIVSLLSQYGYFPGDIYMYWYTYSFSTLTLSFSHLPLPFSCAHSCHHSNLIASLLSYFCSLCFSWDPFFLICSPYYPFFLSFFFFFHHVLLSYNFFL